LIQAPLSAHDLPDFYAITAPLEADGTRAPLLEQSGCRDWLVRFEDLLESGVDLVQLRAKGLSGTDLTTLTAHCGDLAAAGSNDGPVGAASRRESLPKSHFRLILNGPPELVLALGTAGVHLTSAALMALDRRPLPDEFLIGASCHSANELAHAEAIGVDFACLSPVRPVRGYGKAKPLGFGGFADKVRKCGIPVYGLGGLSREDLPEIRKAGGRGIAGISAFW